MENMIKVLSVQPLAEPEVVEIGSDLAGLQAAVGGYIELVYPYEDMVAILCDEEGKLKNRPYNRALRDEDGHIYDVVAGPMYVVGMGDDGVTTLPDDLIAKYQKVFSRPEHIVQEDGKIIVMTI